jgi:hypothetical protein
VRPVGLASSLARWCRWLDSSKRDNTYLCDELRPLGAASRRTIDLRLFNSRDGLRTNCPHRLEEPRDVRLAVVASRVTGPAVVPRELTRWPQYRKDSSVLGCHRCLEGRSFVTASVADDLDVVTTCRMPVQRAHRLSSRLRVLISRCLAVPKGRFEPDKPRRRWKVRRHHRFGWHVVSCVGDKLDHVGRHTPGHRLREPARLFVCSANLSFVIISGRHPHVDTFEHGFGALPECRIGDRLVSDVGVYRVGHDVHRFGPSLTRRGRQRLHCLVDSRRRQ